MVINVRFDDEALKIVTEMGLLSPEFTNAGTSSGKRMASAKHHPETIEKIHE
jgi:hypothetical protein